MAVKNLRCSYASDPCLSSLFLYSRNSCASQTFSSKQRSHVGPLRTHQAYSATCSWSVRELRAELSLSFPVPDGRDESKRHHPSPGEEREPRKSVSYGGWGEELHTGAHSGDRPLPGRLWLRHRRRAPPQHGTKHTPASCFLFPFASCIHNQQSSRKHRAPLGRAEIWGCIFTLVFKIPAIWFSTKGFATSFFLKKNI